MIATDELPFLGIVQPFKLFDKGNGTWSMQVRCPGCGRIHRHSAGNGRQLGYRTVPCGMYWVAQPDEDTAAVVPPSFEVWRETHEREVQR